MQDFVVVTASEKATKTRELLLFSSGHLLWVKQKRSVLLSACGCFLLWRNESIHPPKYSRNLPDLLHNGTLVHGYKVWQPKLPQFTSLSSSLHLGRGGACDIYIYQQAVFTAAGGGNECRLTTKAWKLNVLTCFQLCIP